MISKPQYSYILPRVPYSYAQMCDECRNGGVRRQYVRTYGSDDENSHVNARGGCVIAA